MSQIQFLRTLVFINGVIPLLMLIWDAYRGQLGANPVNNALHITGILSLVFLFLSLMMSPLKWVTGWSGWIAFRRSLGLYGFFYSVIHLFIYVGFDRALSLSSTLNEIWMRRFLQVGTVAIVLMTPLAVTSTNAMIRRLGPVRWKLLHRTAYLVAVLGVLHYYMLVKSDVRQPLAFAGFLTLMLSGRFFRHYYELRQASAKPAAQFVDIRTDSKRPDSQWKGELRIAAVFQETPNVRTFRLMPSHREPFPFEFQAGQFVNIQLSINGKRVNRSYTLASSPTRSEYCELTIKREAEGVASQYIHDHLNVGDLLKISGPSGKFTFNSDEDHSVLLIAGGVGITPLMSITRCLTDRAWTGDIYFLIVARTEQDLIFHDELLLLQKQFRQLHLCVTLTRCEDSDDWKGERGRVSATLLTKFVPNLTSTPVYLCGPNEMMDAVREVLHNVGVPDSIVRTEAFAGKKSVKVTSDLTTSGQTVSKVSFIRSNVQTEIHQDTTILEAAEALSIGLPFECRSGFCGQWRTRLLEGSVQMDCEDALSPAEKVHGWVLACQARPRSDLRVEA